MGKLSVQTVQRAKPGRHADGDGLYLLVQRSGSRSWLLRVQVDGRRRDIGLGSVDTRSKLPGEGIGADVPIETRTVLTLAEAREKAALLRRVAKSGRDPVAERDKDRRPPPTFKAVAIEVHGAKKAGWAQDTADDFLASMKIHAYPQIGDKRVDLVDAAAVQAVLAPIWVSAPAQAVKVRRRIFMILDYAKAKGWRASEAPRAEVRALLSIQGGGKNYPAMPFADAPAFFEAQQGKVETVGRLALMFLILTAARSGEVRKTTWAHMDLKRSWWHRPAELMKGPIQKRRAHSVTLSPAALAILERAAAYRHSTDPDALVFPSSRGGSMSDMTLAKILRDASLPYVPHGFRSTFRDWAAERMPSIPDPVAEAALAHVVSDRVVAAYKRTTFDDLRRTLLDAWGRYVVGDAAKVVALVRTG